MTARREVTVMEVQIWGPLELKFHSTSSSPLVSPPSSPSRFFLSVPSSPSSIQQPPHHQDHHLDNNNNLDFQFDFSAQLHHTDSVSADQLFHAGKIRPLKPPPAPKLEEESRKVDEEGKQLQMRGRSGRASSMSFFPASASSSRRGSRSLSPLRAPSYSDDDDDFSSQASNSNNNNNPIPKPPSSSSFLSSISFTKKGYRKWRLKDFLLFRSASEGRAAGAGKDPLRKYAVLSKKAAAAAEEELTMRNSGSFRSTESGGSGSRRRGAVSAHEMHYTLNRAASEEMKKKTVLPYKQLGPLGCLGFTQGIQSLTR